MQEREGEREIDRDKVRGREEERERRLSSVLKVSTPKRFLSFTESSKNK